MQNIEQAKGDKLFITKQNMIDFTLRMVAPKHTHTNTLTLGAKQGMLILCSAVEFVWLNWEQQIQLTQSMAVFIASIDLLAHKTRSDMRASELK